MSVIVSPKLQGVDPKNIIALFDYDWTMAKKTYEITDAAPLEAQHYQGLAQMSPRVGRFIIVTARGETSVLNYLKEHESTFGRIPNTTLATNSGHWWHKLDVSRPAHPHTIDVPGQTGTQVISITAAIHNVVKDLSKEYSDITADCREMCGAVVYQFEGKKSDNRDVEAPINPRIQAFQNRAAALVKNLDPELAKRIAFSSKEWFDPNYGQTRGYIDMIPVGMNKGHTTPVIFQHYAEQLDGQAFAIVAGDSSADYDMMKAIAKIVPANRRLFVCVGKDLVKLDKEFEAQNGYRLLDEVLIGNGKAPVDQFHDFLTTIGNEEYYPQMSAEKRQTRLDRRSVTAEERPGFGS